MNWRWPYPVFVSLFIVVISFLFAKVSSEHFMRIHDVEYLYTNSEDVDLSKIQTSEFHSATNRTIPPAKDTLWLKIKIPNKVANWPGDSVLYTGSNETALLMNGFLVHDHEVKNLGICDVRIESDECRLPTLQYAFPIDKNSFTENSILYLKIIPGPSGVNNEFYFFKRSYFNKVTIFLTFYLGVGSGIYIIVSLLALVLYFTMKENSFLIYSLFYLNLLLSLLINRGIWDLFRPDFVRISGTSLMLPVLFLTLFFDLKFLQVFFEMPRKNKNINIVFTISLFAVILMVILSLVPQTRSFALNSLSEVISASTILAAVTLAYFIWQKRLWAVPIATAWGVALVCNLIWISFRTGRIEGFWLFGYYSIFGRSLEAILLNYVLFQKLRNLTLIAGKSKAQIEESKVVKTLLRTLSHDLSNTTQIIKTSAQLLSENKNPDFLEKRINYIAKAADSQSLIIENAKKYFLVRGGLIINLAPVDLKKCLNEVIETFDYRIKQKNISLLVEMPASNLIIFAEKTSLMNQVLSNALSNAVKFTKPGRTITISTKIFEPDTIELKIIDEGIGIPPALLERLFDEATDVTRPGTSGETGTGTGMLIMKDFAQAYGAEFNIESVVGKGTQLIFKFKKFK